MSFSQHWKQRKEQLEAQKATGKAFLTVAGRRLQVNVPFNPDFAKGAAELAGTYRHKTSTWSFRLQSRNLVVALANRVFGEENVNIIGEQDYHG